MSDNPGPISRLKAIVAREVSAAPLAGRLVAGATSRYDASAKLDAVLAQAGFSLHGLWTLSPAEQAVAQLWWLSAVGWEIAERFFAQLTSATHRQFIDRDGVPWCEGLCADAETYTTEAVRCQSQVEVQVSVPPPQFKQLKDLPVTDDLVAGTWAILEAIYERVQEDQNSLLGMRVPKRFRPVLHEIVKIVHPNMAVFEHLRQEWSSATTANARLGVVKQGFDPIRALFRGGQMCWAPSLTGQVYLQCLRAQPTLEDLEFGFDPWLLTDPLQRTAREPRQEHQQELTRFWERVTSPGDARQLSLQLEQWLQTGKIRLRYGRGYNTVPWPSQYLVRYPVSFGGRSFQTGDLIAVFVNRESDHWRVEVRRTGRAQGALELLGHS